MKADVCHLPASPLEEQQTWDRDQAQQVAKLCLSANTCLWCEVCQLICPDLAITRDLESGDIIIDLDFCKGCGLCAFFCPKGAIHMELEQTS
jgi:2-oxoacid:acceptor oxidoreductase delta subunit (pyruvate/2-ketoisovalerate family)